MGLFKDCGCGCNGKIQEDKFVISLISGLVFFIVANPETFRLVRRIAGPMIASPNGCPTTTGLLVHTVVFILIVWGMMNVKKNGKSKGPRPPPVKPKKGTKKIIDTDAETEAEAEAEAEAEPKVKAPLPPMDIGSDGNMY